MIFKNVLETIGNTPIVKLNRVSAAVEAETGAKLFAKLEFMNPGGSIKDRIGWYMIEDAEKRGLIQPGGTIVECTSGNTGIGLAMACILKGYKAIFVMPDKMSKEKVDTMKAFGAEVVITPTNVDADDPRSYYSVARRIAQETPNAIHLHQYNNLSNRECHYKFTGPEVFGQMPEIDAFVAGIGTGGTVCGIGKYLKEKKPGVQVIAVDPVGSIVYDTFKTGKAVAAPKTYKIEGIGEDFIPKNYDFSVIDDMVQVEDQESFLMTRRILKEEGIYCGISCGSAVVGALRWMKSQGRRITGKNVLVVLPDSGNRYLSKVFNDDWMKAVGFLDS
jgi:cystathionine beta-synthase